MKLNLDNNIQFDDNKLIKNLKRSFRKEPSKDFNNKVLSQINLEQKKVIKKRQHLVLPLVLMTILGLLLIVQLIFLMNGWELISKQLNESYDVVSQTISSFNNWYSISLVLILFLIQLFIFLESKINQNRSFAN